MFFRGLSAQEEGFTVGSRVGIGESSIKAEFNQSRNRKISHWALEQLLIINLPNTSVVITDFLIYF